MNFTDPNEHALAREIQRMTTATVTTTEALLACALDGTFYLGGEYEDYGDAIAAWYRHDDARRAGLRPHVRFYEVRSVDDPKVAEARKNGSYAPVKALFRSTNRQGRGFASARIAVRHHVALTDEALAAKPWIRQGNGGWYYEADGQTLAQGLDGRGGLADVAKRRGWIVQGADGRWHVTAPVAS